MGNPKQDEASSSDALNAGDSSDATSAAIDALTPAFSSKRAADMFAAYSKHTGLDLGGGGDSESGSNKKTGPALLAEIKEGAERLANELDVYLSKGSGKPFIPDKDAPPLSDEAVADLQLATARKLREVSR
jgi:hypothetical protein